MAGAATTRIEMSVPHMKTEGINGIDIHAEGSARAHVS